jgi:hypothetical protein
MVASAEKKAASATHPIRAFARSLTATEHVIIAAILAVLLLIAPARRPLLWLLVGAYVILLGIKLLGNRPLSGGSYTTNAAMRSRLGLAGALVLFIGLFTPIIHVPIAGSINYFQNGHGAGMLLLAFAIAAVVLVFTSRFRYLKWVGGLSLLVVCFALIRLLVAISVATHYVANTRPGEGNPFVGLERAAVASIQVQWGWLLLIAGSLLILVAGLDDRMLSRLMNRVATGV